MPPTLQATSGAPPPASERAPGATPARLARWTTDESQAALELILRWRRTPGWISIGRRPMWSPSSGAVAAGQSGRFASSARHCRTRGHAWLAPLDARRTAPLHLLVGAGDDELKRRVWD